VKALCPFKAKCKDSLEESFPNIRIVVGTHEEHITPEEFRRRVKKLFCMVNIILNKDE